MINDDKLLAECQKLKMPAAAEEILRQRRDPKIAPLPVEERLLLVLKAEREAREGRRCTRLLKECGLNDPWAELERSTFAEDWGITEAHVRELAQCHWITDERPRWLLVSGMAGVGKTHLATLLCKEACKRGLRPKYFKTFYLLEEIRKILAGDGTNWQKAYEKVDLLVLDDFNLEGASASVVRALFEKLDSRYNRKAVMIVTQHSPENLYDHLGESGICRDSIMDRLVNGAEVLRLKGESKRSLYKPNKAFGS